MKYFEINEIGSIFNTLIKCRTNLSIIKIMVDRLNQELELDDLVLICHPKTSVLLRCIVKKINAKTVTVHALPESEKENETSQYCQHDMVGIGDHKFHGNYFRISKGFNRRPEEVVKIGHYRTIQDNGKDIHYSNVEIGDEELWPTDL